MRTRYLAAAAGAVTCALAAGCGSVPAGGAAPGGGAGTPATAAARPGPATAAGNRRLAAAEAGRLLALVPVPAHSVRLSKPPRSVSWPAMGKPGVQSLVDQIASWRLDMSFAAASSWITAQRPAGLHQLGVATTPPNGQQVLGYSYTGGVSAAWGSAELDIEVVPAGPGRSVMRADGLVVWLDPDPVLDTVAGQRLRVLAAGNCPAADRNVVGVTNPLADLARALLPAGRPRSGLECTYYGMNGRPFQLRSQRRLSTTQAARLAAALARIPLSHAIGGIVYCPMDDGSAEAIALSYPGRPDVDLWLRLNGCRGLSNGYITVAAL